MGVMHHHPRAAAEGLPVLLPFKPYHHRAVQAAIIFQLQALLYLPELSHLPFGAHESEPHYLPTVIPLAMADLKLYLVPLPIVIVGEDSVILGLELLGEGRKIHIVLLPHV